MMRASLQLPKLATLAVAFATVLARSAAPVIAAEPDSSMPSASVTPTVTRVRTLLVSGQVEAAREQVQSLVEASPDDAASLALLGDVLFRLSKFADAERAYRRAAQTDPNCARAQWGLGRLEMLASRRLAARDHIAAAFQLDPSDPDIVLSYADFVQNAQARIVLLRNFLELAGGRSEDKVRVEDAAARMEITERLGQVDLARLASPYRSYHLKLAGYFPNGGPQSGLLIPVSLNGGKPLRLILDSGADGIFLSGDRARITKVERLTGDRIAGVGSARDGNAYVAVARHVAMGALEFEDCLVHVTEARSFPNADGVIGMNVFEKFLLRVDPASATLDLVPYADGANVSSISAGMVRAYRVGHLLLLHASVDGRQDRYFLLDTGASFSSTPGPSSGDAGIEVRGVEGRVDGALRAPPMRLTIEGKELVDERPVKLDLTELSRHEGVEISGIIGYPVLGKSVLTINYREGLVRFGQPNR
jgi:tetratricopeptide (TPR) repeat protein